MIESEKHTPVQEMDKSPPVNKTIYQNDDVSDYLKKLEDFERRSRETPITVFGSCSLK
ncbi:MAG: hypothetical protein FWF24_06460 [Alphaproteobacteria bacterium]|nr:hypothetical protein [Alphaproteobacteria bacterium]